MADRDLTRFSVCGSQFVDKTETPTPLQVLTDSAGYDGQFFTRLAFNPFSDQRRAYGITLDSPAYRQQRILYPLLSWILAQGKASNAPWALVTINFMALLGIALVAGKFCQEHGLSPANGLLVLLSGGFILSFGRNLAEPLAGFFVITSLYQIAKQRLCSASLLATAAVLTREPALITFAACGSVLCLSELTTDKKSYNFLWLLLPLAAYLSWCVFLKNTWGAFPFSANTGALQPWPLINFFRQLSDLPLTTKPFVSAVYLLYLFWYGQLALEVITALRNRSPLKEGNQSNYLIMLRTAWVVWLIFASFLSAIIWEDDWGFTRILAEWSLLGWLCIFVSGQRPSKKIVATTLLIAAGSIFRLWLRP